jgi:hypothetical protein
MESYRCVMEPYRCVMEPYRCVMERRIARDRLFTVRPSRFRVSRVALEVDAAVSRVNAHVPRPVRPARWARGMNFASASFRSARFFLARRYAIEGAQPIAHFARPIAKLRVERGPCSRAASPPGA